MRRFLFWFFILVVVVAVATTVAIPARSWWQQRSAPKYLTAKVSRGSVEAGVNSTGTIKPVRTVSVGAFTSGPIAEIYVDFNCEVRKGDVLALIDDRLLAAGVERDRAAVETHEAELKRIQALLDQAQRNEARADKLFKANKEYISDTEMDQFRSNTLTLEAQYKLALASIRQAKATLKNSEDNLSYTKIRAPEDGIILERKVDPGQTVAASFQTPELFIIAPEMDQHMFVYASVDEADIGLIRTAQRQQRPVKFTVDAYPGDLFEGQIYQIRNNSTTTQNVVTYPVIIEAANPEMKLLPGMTANLSFQIEVRENVLRLPSAALRFLPVSAQVRPEDRHYVEALPTNPTEGTPRRSAADKADQARNRHRRIVWVQEGHLLRAVPVTLGLIENQHAEVLSGDLTEGQAVVTGIESLFGGR